jgi:hypothetical protein
MKKTLISVDRLIARRILNNATLNEISCELKNKSEVLFKLVNKNNAYKSIYDFLNCINIEPKFKYIQEYTHCCIKRKNDINWVMKSKKFNKLDVLSTFKLVKLIDKLKSYETRKN